MRKTDEKLEQMQRDFKVFYDNNLRQIYEMLEPTRRLYLKKFWKRFLFTVAVVLFIWSLCHFDFIGPNIYGSEPFMLIGTILALLTVFWISFPFLNYHDNVKSKVMVKLLEFWGKFEYFRKKKIINYFTLQQSEIFTYFNSEDVDDAFSGTYKNADLKVSEHSLRIHGSKGDIVIFNGVFILLKFNKSFKSKTVLLSKWRRLGFLFNNKIIWMVLLPPIIASFSMAFKFRDFNVFAGVFLGLLSAFIPLFAFLLLMAIIYRIYRYFRPKKATKKVLLEGIPFLRRWNVYTDNQVEARYILTPVLMEKMLKIKKLFHGNFIDFSFCGHNLLIAVHTNKNLFETTSFFRSALRYRKVKEVVNQLYSIFSVVDILDIEDAPKPEKATPRTKKDKKGKKK